MVDVSWVLITTSKLTLRVLRLIDCNEIAFLALHVDCSHKQGDGFKGMHERTLCILPLAAAMTDESVDDGSSELQV